MDMKYPAPFPMYDVEDDMDSTSHHIYDMYDYASMIISIYDELGVQHALNQDENLAQDELPFEDI